MKKLLLILPFLPLISSAQQQLAKADTLKGDVQKTTHWYDNVSLKGFIQFRYNRLGETNPKLKCEACDRSMGEGGGLFLRRARLIFYGQLSPRVYFLIHEDLSSAVSGTSVNFGQLRDAFMDIGLDKKNEFRIRLGQSKVPYGFENMQGSALRLPLDRTDAINSGIPNEHDLAALVYWAPDKIRKRLADLNNDRMKGSGDYGVFGFGVFNGQTMDKPELNNELHVVARGAYPFKIGNQILEPSVQAYTGHYVIASDMTTAGVKIKSDRSYLDQRAAASLVLYPKPFGVQAEYNIGVGPEFNKATDSIEDRSLHGGYVLVNYLIDYKKSRIQPFVRWQYYNGGKKNELDARSYTVNETEIGIEWLPYKNFEFTAQYTISSRRFEDFKTPDNIQKGNLLRLQAQLNF